MADTASKRATYDDLLALPENVVGEIISGVLHVQPRPRWGHGRAATSLGGELYQPFGRGKGGPGGWVFVVEAELHLGEDVLVPDLGGWRQERAPTNANDAWTDIAPDWICEILSPSTMQRDRVLKAEAYAREGVPYLWYVDPSARTLEAFRLEGKNWLQIAALAEDADVSVAPFDAISFKLDALWA